MIRILHICAAMNDGGVERMIMNYLSVVDRGQIQFDFVVHSTKVGFLEARAEKLGSKIYHVPAKSRHPFTYFRTMKRIYKEGGYDIVHCHQGHKSVYPLLIAKWCHIPVRIAHAHVNMNRKNGNILQRVFRYFEAYLTETCSTLLMACSSGAGKIWGEKHFTLIPDAIDLDKFSFSGEIRDKVRKEMSVDDNFVIGCVGRMVESKNHERLLQIMEKLQTSYPYAVLLLVGSGPLEGKLKESAAKRKLDKIIFAGSCENVAAYLNACDVFVLPTLTEGFGMAILEAQINGLETITSDVVPEEVLVSERIHTLSLTADDEEWVKAIVSTMGRPRGEVILNPKIDLYDIRVQADKLVGVYREALMGRGCDDIEQD
ncbi:MAG: glycosyltransferase [Lachnospiraceae bacterium]|nr:glycosyltransferase [Lachnospiraceae bacterium]